MPNFSAQLVDTIVSVLVAQEAPFVGSCKKRGGWRTDWIQRTSFMQRCRDWGEKKRYRKRTKRGDWQIQGDIVIICNSIAPCRCSTSFKMARVHEKHPKVAESAISALVQTSFLISVVVGVESVTSLDLSNADLQSMATSIAVSCCSAGLSFAARDKSDSAVLALPGKTTWGPTMGCLVLVRSMEVASRMICFNVIQVSIRGPWFLGHVSGPIAVVLYAAAAALCFREAELADILAPRTQNHDTS